jgi:TonB family protein
VLVLFMPEFFACADQAVASSRPRGADLPFETPMPVIGPTVRYPEQFRRSGMPRLDVFLRVWVSHGGCVSGVETLRGVLPAFDIEAIESMVDAKMKPGTLGGEPIDSTITYMVTFSLR